MTMPFKNVASQVSEPSFTKHLVISDWDGTIMIRDQRGRPAVNYPLVLLLTLAQEKGHDVVVTTHAEIESLKGISYLSLEADMSQHFPDHRFPNFEALSKFTFRKHIQSIRPPGETTALVAFDNEPETIHEYADAMFEGAVGFDGYIESLTTYANVLGVKDQFEKELSEYNQRVLQASLRNPNGPK